MLRSIVLLVLFAASGVAAAKPALDENTLGANDHVPNYLIETQLSDTEAEALLTEPYLAFYQVNGKAIGSTMHFKKISNRRSYPDDRLADVAKSIAAMADRPLHNTGSRVKPRATAFVAFYEGRVDGFSSDQIQYLPTSAEKAPNIMAVLIVQDTQNSATKNGGRTVRTAGGPEGSDVYLFELAL